MPANIKQKKPISKHLMLKFIATPLCQGQRNVDFKTSYVEVYLLLSAPGVTGRQISKHLMLKFITSPIKPFSCWCDFKTSYVEVYLLAVCIVLFPQQFQNILC